MPRTPLIFLVFVTASCTRPEPPPPPEPCSDPTAFAQSRGAEAWAPGASPREQSEGLWRAWVDQCALDEIVALTTELVRFETVSAEQSPADGPAFAAMAQFLQRWASDAGLGFNSVGANDAWEVTYGSGTREILFVAHGDVVPVAKKKEGEALPVGWSSPPFEARVVEGRLYGRGTEDDKGPVATVMTLMSSMARFGLSARGQIVLAIGTGEEHGWEGMQRYAEKAAPARFAISIDASFPIVVAQSGFVRWVLGIGENIVASGRAKSLPGGPLEIRVDEASGGEFLTQVPGEATMVLVGGGGDLSRFMELVDKAVEEEKKKRRTAKEPFTFEVERVPEPAPRPGIEHPEPVARARVTVRGEAIHSSVAHKGHNALWPLASIAARLHVRRDGYGAMMRLLAELFDGDHHGVKLGIAHEDPVMGPLLVAPTILKVEGDELRLSINMRRPRGPDAEKFRTQLTKALGRIQKKIDRRLHEVEDPYIGEPHFAETEGPLVSTLLDIFRRWSKDPNAAPISIRGGTYGRLFAGAVDFGPSLPGRPYTGHKPDEYVELETLSACARMWRDAILELQAIPSKTPVPSPAKEAPELLVVPEKAPPRPRRKGAGGSANEPPRFSATPDGIREAMGYIAYDVRECYDAWLKLGHPADGKIHVHYAIVPDEDGGAQPQRVVITDSTLQHTAIEGCVSNAVSSLEFEPPADGELQVTYPLKFSSGEGEKAEE